MSASVRFYLCPVCFTAQTDRHEGHDHPMIVCDVGQQGDLRCKPLIDAAGRVRTRAPRWFLESVGWISARPTDGAR